MKNEEIKPCRKRGHGFWQGLLKIFIRKPRFMFLGEEKFEKGSIILSNHVGKSAPLMLDLYLDIPFRFWGAHEMNDGLKSLYKYQSEVFYHQKSHWPLFWARLFCLIASPITYFFYKGLNLISTYKDHRFKRTIKESIETIKKEQSVVIFPEDSDKGYFDNLTGFHAGFAILGKTCYKKGIDTRVYVTYLNKKKKVYVIDKPILFSELIKDGFDREKIARKLCDRANELQKISEETSNK